MTSRRKKSKQPTVVPVLSRPPPVVPPPLTPPVTASTPLQTTSAAGFTPPHTSAAAAAGSGPHTISTATSLGTSRRGKRGCASFSKKFAEKDLYILFDINNKPVGPTRKYFMSWYGLMVKQRLPLHIKTGKVPKKLIDKIWKEAKAFWNIQTDEPKDLMRKKAIKISTNFKSRLVTNFVNKGKNACDKYSFIKVDEWNEFVTQKTTPEFKEISEKAKANAAKQTSVPRLGRSGWTGIEEKADFIWPILVEKYPLLDKMKNERSRLYIMGRAKRIKKAKGSETDSYELPLDAITTFGDLVRVEREMIADGSYLKEKDDPLVRVLGSEHGGRSRTVSEVIGATRVHGGLYKNGRKRARNDSGANVNFDTSSASPVNVSQPLHGASCESVGRIDYPPIESMTPCELILSNNAPIESMTPCELILPVASTTVIVANGVAWPTSDRVLHGNLIKEGCAKVHVDSIVDKYSEYSVFNVTMTDEVQKVGDMLRSFIQWPRSALKLVNKETTSKSASASITTSSHGSLSHRSASPQIIIDDFATTSCYRPQFEVVDTHLQFQPQGDMMQHQVGQGGLMNMLSNVYKFRSASQDQFELHAFEPEVSPEADFHPAPEFIDPNVAPALDFIDPDVAPALDSIRNRPQPVRELVDRLSAHVGNDYVIEVVSPNGMYPEPVDEDIPYSELLQIFLNAWLDVTVLHWFAMHFFESSNSRCAFFNPQLINAPLCKRNRAGVGKHIQDIYTLHSEKMFFIAPYLAGKHWSLLIVCPTYKSGYIIDSKRTGKNKNSYLLVSILEEVFRVRFNWHVVKCKQQSSSWECGYMVIKHMQEFVQYIQHDLVNRFWNEEGNFPHSEIEDLVLRLMPEFINKVFEDPTR
ncbi:hypothetical protein SSX86_020441 [Deinandra increscens subsp. villosa]|uniref:Ubiquitin-like protease family profile domain-containing protein n=1 Tax=Deinandra increscens subsp. villosa TaxID=3103831 RepID=A0AAP0CT41_9ASTR